MSYGYYSLNNLTASEGLSGAITILGVEPVEVAQTSTPDTATISLHESPAGTINFAGFGKSLSVNNIYSTTGTFNNIITDNIYCSTGIFDVIYTNSITGPFDLRGPQGPQGPTGHIGPQGSSGIIPSTLTVNNLIVNNMMTGNNAEFSGFLVADNVFGANTITAPFITSEHFQGSFFDMATGYVREYLEIPPWQVGTYNTNQLQIINKNSSLPTLIFIPSVQNGYMLSNTILPSDNTKTLGSIGSKWSEGHFKKIYVDNSTIEFIAPTGTNTGANATIKSQYLDFVITGPYGNIPVQGQNIQATYISSTGGFFDYTTSLLSTTEVSTSLATFTDSIQGIRRDMTGVCNFGAGITGTSNLSITGSNLGGIINLTTSSGCLRNYTILEIDFIYPFQNDPAVILQAGNQATSRLLGDSSVFVDTTLNKFIIYSGNTPLRPFSYYKWYYQIIG